MSADSVTRLARLAAWEATFAAPDFAAGTWGGGERDADGVISMPYFVYSEAVNAFTREMYELEWVIPFDWMAWSVTADGRRLSSSTAAIATASEADLSKVLTTILRSDRFSEGALASAIEGGFVVAVARRAGVLADVERS